MAIHPGPRTKRLIALAVALVAIALVARFFYNRSTHVYMDDARVDGNVITISSLTAGQVSELPVTQGDAVRAGQLLVRIDARDDILRRDMLLARLGTIATQSDVLKAQSGQVAQESEGKYQSEASRLVAAEAEVASVEAQQKQARAEFERARELTQQKWLSPQALERSATDLRSAEEKYRKAVAELAAVRGQLAAAQGSRRQVQVVGRQGVVLERQADEIRAEIRRLDNDIRDRTILSPGDGVVVMTFVRAGEHVSAGQRILMYHNPAEVWVEANVKETEVARLKLGMPAQVRVDAFPGEVFKGEIERIGDAATSKFALLPNPNPSGNFTRVTQRLPLRIRLADKAARLKPGMLVEVDVDTRHP